MTLCLLPLHTPRRGHGISFDDSMRSVTLPSASSGAVGGVGEDSVEWRYGFKLHLIVNRRGSCLPTLTWQHRRPRPRPDLTKDLFGKLLPATDKGYISQALFEKLCARGTRIDTET